MSLVIVLPLIIIVGASTTTLSFWLLSKAIEQPPSDWVVIHVVSPLLRILSLIIAVSLIFPVLFPQSSVMTVWQLLFQQNQVNDLLNLLFVASLLLSFLPVLGHPMIALPVQSCLTTALLFDWFFMGQADSITWLPDWTTLLKLTIAMLIILLVGNQAAKRLAKHIDDTYHLSGSIQLVSDVIYLPLLMPIVMIYGSWLQQQLPITVVTAYI